MKCLIVFPPDKPMADQCPRCGGEVGDHPAPIGLVAHIDPEMPVADRPTRRQAELPRDNDGQIITSASFGEAWFVRIFYNTDPEGEWVEEGDWSNVTLHGPFNTRKEADEWMEAYPDGDRDLKDMDIILVNRVRP